jgi:hypothetical protein
MKLTEVPKYFRFDKLTPIPEKSDYYEDEEGWVTRVSIYPKFTVTEFANPSNKHFCRPTLIELN